MKKNRFTKFLQNIWLTYSNYLRNTLFEGAAALSFGFVFSFIPIILIALGIASGTLAKYPEVTNYLLDLCSDFNTVYDIRPLIKNFSQRQAFSVFDIILYIWVIWIARKFFLSMARNISRIFHSETPQKGYVIQLMTFIGEFALIIGLIAIVVASFLLNRFFTLQSFDSLSETFPLLFSHFMSRLSSIIFYSVIFLFSLLIFRFESRTAPSFASCLWNAALLTVSFLVVSAFINKFTNFSNYTLIYGAISSVIILMVKVYMFFILFLFFAEKVYVTQNLDTLLFCEMYMLPPPDSKKIIDKIKRQLFINPSVLQDEENTLFLKKGDILYSTEDTSDSVYFIKKGSIIEEFENEEKLYEKGMFFGEKSAMLKRPRKGTTNAATDSEIIKIDAETFRSLLIKNPRASAFAMGKL
ncbi:MAG: YihY/virulence factor BrkB family protein [Treponema sp.]|nr:YihY/virulence factor BrkB family protein [Treponema sp.]